MTPTVHIVEPGGRGGIHQHAVALAEHLAGAGVPVVLNTAADAETAPGAVARRVCFWSFGSLRPRAVRRLLIVGGWLVRGLPSVLSGTAPGDVVHVEGRFKPMLLLPLVLAARLRGCRLTFDPHTTFPRQRPGSRDALVRWIARRADAVVAHSEHDGERVASWGGRPVRMPLLVRVGTPEADLVRAWRRRWGAEEGRPVVLLAGQLRADKGPDLLVRAAAESGGPLVLALVGEDLGAVAPVRLLAAILGVDLVVDPEYQPLDRFVAALAAADLVVCPYRRASQSAVLAMARALGRPTVATAVGGLAELATVVVPPDDPEALATGIAEALRMRVPARGSAGAAQVLPYLRLIGARPFLPLAT